MLIWLLTPSSESAWKFCLTRLLAVVTVLRWTANSSVTRILERSSVNREGSPAVRTKTPPQQLRQLTREAKVRVRSTLCFASLRLVRFVLTHGATQWMAVTMRMPSLVNVQPFVNALSLKAILYCQPVLALNYPWKSVSLQIHLGLVWRELHVGHAFIRAI